MKHLLLLIPFLSFAQSYDTIITTPIYKSYYSKHYRNPIILTYTLYHGGGTSKRDGMTFKNDIKTLSTATNHDYDHMGYDKGHLANAEDFASNPIQEELTFRYYNCVPQTPNLNRGGWKSCETTIRKVSQNDSLFVVCYNTFNGSNWMHSVAIPNYCYKFVYNVSKKKWIYAFKFTNTSLPEFTNLMDSIPNFIKELK